MKPMFALLAASLAATASAGAAQPARQPNFLVIVADDIGWSDLGAFGGEIATPNLDALAYGGVRFTGFHTAPTCSPTRAMLMSGVDNHEAGLGSMAELLVPAQRGQPGYEGYLNDRVASIAELLHQGGYRTVMAGKWHLGLSPERGPAARGFEHSFALLEGLANHFGADQSAAWAAIGAAPTYRDDGAIARYPTGRFSADVYADRLIDYLERGRDDPRPFFAYLAFTTPHWPMQAPPEDIARYKGRYDTGYEALRAERLARAKRLGLVAADVVPHPLEEARPWATLTTGERAAEARTMEVYAAMVDRTDRDVGRVIEALRRTGRYDDTVIVFLGDNGPEGGTIDHPQQADTQAKLATLGIDNSLANIGAATSYVGYGSGWAQANSAPSWLFKAYTTEGGTRTAAFVAGAGVAGHRIAGADLSVIDVAPTLLSLAGLRQPTSFAGHPILPHEGHSLAPLLAGRTDVVRGPQEVVGSELFYRRAVRQGDWKAVYLPRNAAIRGRTSVGDGRWRLFDVARDPGETRDLAAAEPRRLRTLTVAWDVYAKNHQVVVPPRDEPIPVPVAGDER
ncbi:arylsulfatase [Sphingomonas bacterium]|uniref:arylsulfatase n=1 Tax=Sphingomonas bacterium TaxID=1895847 RepID=UPI001C2D55A7|nr:arylsulfatase [Sphingomonas bacterium]